MKRATGPPRSLRSSASTANGQNSLGAAEHALEAIDPVARAMLDLSIRRQLPDSAVADLARMPPDELVRWRGEVLDQLAAQIGLTGPGARTEVHARLEVIKSSAWLGPPVGAPPKPHTRRGDGSTAHSSRTALLLAIVASAAGVLIVSLGYAAGRDGRSWAVVPYWAGYLLTFIPLAAYVLAPRTRNKGSAVVALAAFQFLIKWMYSPLMFKYSDELQHRPTALDMLHHQSLFHANAAMPVSPRFPGLEEITTALTSISGLDLFTAGQIVVGLAHVALAAGIFVLLRKVTQSDWLAGVAAIVFSISPHNPYFNGLWIYEAPALVFMAVALFSAIRRRSVPGLVTAIICLAAVAVTHHVTAAVTALTLLALGIGVAVQGSLRTDGWRLLSLGAVGTALIVSWVVFVAPITYDYLAGPLDSLVSGFLRAGSATSTDPVGGAGVSPITTAATAIGTATVAALVLAGVFVSWRRRFSALTRTFAMLGLGFFAILGIRFLASNGAEIAGRLLTYEYLFVCVAAALALMMVRSRRQWITVALGLAVLIPILVGNRTSGLPAYVTVPGKFQVEAFEGGIDPAGVRAARWASDNLPVNAKVACDWTPCSLLGSYGRQLTYSDVPDIFYSPSFDAQTLATLSDRGIDFVLVDRRITSQVPIGHDYFNSESATQQAATPLPPSGLEKFDRSPQVDRIYDGGPVVAYDVRRLRGG
jgi:hypothetical protein